MHLKSIEVIEFSISFFLTFSVTRILTENLFAYFSLLQNLIVITFLLFLGGDILLIELIGNSSRSRGIEHSHYHSKLKGLSPATIAGKGENKWCKKFYDEHISNSQL